MDPNTAETEGYVMRQVATKRTMALLAAAAVCAGCGSTSGLGTSKTETAPTAAARGGVASGQYGQYGNADAVEATISTVKLQGHEDLLSSRAVRLPERPLGQIAVYGYRFPPSCGAHEFRVYEAEGTQILEYRFADQHGRTQAIRDYIQGPSPFAAPGLWTAYDHTENSISTMKSQVEQRGDRLFKGVYSRGLVTGLADAEQRALGAAYQRAIGDAYACQAAQALASTTGE
jgi:hypothetical protein